MIGCDSVGFIALYWHCCNNRFRSFNVVFTHFTSSTICILKGPFGDTERHKNYLFKLSCILEQSNCMMTANRRTILTLYNEIWWLCRDVNWNSSKADHRDNVSSSEAITRGVDDRTSGNRVQHDDPTARDIIICSTSTSRYKSHNEQLKHWVKTLWVA